MKEKKKERLYAWTVWLFGAIFLFYKYAIEVSPSVMTTSLMSDFQIDGAQLGNLAACYFYSYLIMQIPAGLLVDKYGPRLITSIAIIFCALGSLIFCYTHDFTTACLGRFLNGIGAAFAAINCLKLTANWFPLKKFAFMAGLMMTIGMLGAVGGQAPLAFFISSIGWRYALMILGYVGLAFGVAFFFIVRNRPKYHEDIHIIPGRKEIFLGFINFFKKSQAWLLSIYSGLAFAPVSVFGGLWGVPYLMKYADVSHEMAAHIISYVFIGFAVGAPIMGWISDRFRSRKLIMYYGTFFAFATLSIVLYLDIRLISFISFLLFLFGFFISSFLLSFTMIREITAPILAATAIGFMNTFDALVGAFSDPLTGKILDMFWDGSLVNGARIFSIPAFQISLSVLPLYLLVSFILLFWIKETCSNETYPSCLP